MPLRLVSLVHATVPWSAQLLQALELSGPGKWFQRQLWQRSWGPLCSEIYNLQRMSTLEGVT